MDILYITTSYELKANSAAIRNNAWVAGLIELGHNVTVLTVEWPDFMKSKFLINENKAKVVKSNLSQLKLLETTSNLNKTNLPKLIHQIKNIIKNIIYFPDICFNWQNNINYEEIDKFDVIISSSDFKSSHYVGLKFKKKFPQKKWIQIWGDPWRTDINIDRLTSLRAKKAEYNILNKSDEIIYVSELTKDDYIKKFPNLKSKIHYIPRGYYKEVIKTDNKNIIIKIVYTGVLNTTGRDIKEFVKAINIYNEHSTNKINLDIYGYLDTGLKKTLSEYKYVKLNEPIDYEDILKVYNESDFLLFISNDNSSTQIPGKLFDYLGTNLPILCLIQSNNSNIFKILSDFKNCILIENNKEKILNILPNLFKYKNCKYEIYEDFAPKNTAKQLEIILNK